MKPRHSVAIIVLFIFAGLVLEIVAFWIGIAFTGVKDFGPHWLFATTYYLGFWPDWFLPQLPPEWGGLYLIAPAFGWGLVGLSIAVAARLQRGTKLRTEEKTRTPSLF